MADINFPSDQRADGRTLGDEEIQAVADAIRSGTLTSTKGTFTKALEKRFAEHLGVEFAYACTSGTAAVHCAVAAIDPEPGDEIVTTPITDMGALAPIVYQGAIPVFADVEPVSCNVTAESIEAVLSERTKAIIVTHLFGNPCDMDAIGALAKARGIPVIEDAAQAYGATWGGRRVGSIGDIGCFSLQQGKHITTGEGGIVATNDADHARRMFLYINKAWGYGDAKPDHYFLALNYRMSELQGAVALAQLDEIEGSVAARVRNAKRLDEGLTGLAGITLPTALPKGAHSYWRYCLRVDPEVVPGGPGAMAQQLRHYDVASAPRYVQKPAFRCQVFAEQRTFGDSRWPFTLARPEAVDYSEDRYPGAFSGLEGILVFPFNEKYTEAHTDHLVSSIRAAHASLMGDKS